MNKYFDLVATIFMGVLTLGLLAVLLSLAWNIVGC